MRVKLFVMTGAFFMSGLALADTITIAPGGAVTVGTTIVQCSAAGGHTEEIELSRCFIDPSFNSQWVYFSKLNSDEYYAWYHGSYDHAYTVKRTVLMVHYDDHGAVAFQREVTQTESMSQNFRTEETIGIYSGRDEMKQLEPHRPAVVKELQPRVEAAIASRQNMQCPANR
jgi:hypothetical protein